MLLMSFKNKINVDVYDPWIKDKNIINRDIRFIETQKLMNMME